MSKVKIEFTTKTGSTLTFSNKHIKNFNITKDQVKDHELPVFGFISQSGSIVINDIEKQIYNLIEQEELDNDTKIKVYLKDVLYGTYFVSNPDYDTTNYTLTIQIDDVLSKLKSIEMDEISISTKNNSWLSTITLYDLFEIFKNKVNKQLKGQTWYGFFTQFRKIKIGNANLEKGTASEQFEKMLFMGSCISYCDKDGSIYIEPKYSAGTNVDYHENKYYYITKNKMLSNIRSNIFKTNKFNNVVIENYQDISSFQKTIFDIQFDLKRISGMNNQQVNEAFPELKDFLQSKTSIYHSLIQKSSEFEYIQFYMDIDVDSSVNNFYKYNVLCTKTGEIDDYTGLIVNTNTGEETSLVVSNGEYQSNEYIYKPNVKIRFVDKSLWENGNTQWNTMNFNDYSYDSLNRKKVPVYGYIDIVRLSNNKVRLYCRLSYRFALYIYQKGSIKEDGRWVGVIDSLKFNFSSFEQLYLDKEFYITNTNKQYKIQAPKELLDIESFMPDFTEGWHNVYENGLFVEEQWQNTGTVCDIISKNLLENFRDGLMFSEVSVMLGDYKCANNTNNIDWSIGKMFSLGNKVVLTKNNDIENEPDKNSIFLDSQGKARVFEIISMELVYEGYPKLNLKLLEIRKDWYDKGNLGRIDR